MMSDFSFYRNVFKMSVTAVPKVRLLVGKGLVHFCIRFQAGGRRIPMNIFHSVSDGGILNALPQAARRFVRIFLPYPYPFLNICTGIT